MADFENKTMHNGMRMVRHRMPTIPPTTAVLQIPQLRQEMPVPVSTVQQIRMHIRTVTTATPHRIRTRQCTAVHTSSRTLPALPITIRQAVRPLPPETAAAATTAATLCKLLPDPNGGDPNKKPKKKHTGLKVAAFVLAMVLVSGGSIGVYEGIRSSNADNSSSIVASNDSSAAESSTGDSSSSKRATPVRAGFSWLLPTVPCR